MASSFHCPGTQSRLPIRCRDGDGHGTPAENEPAIANRRKAWCGRGDLNPHGLAPNGFSYQLRLSPSPPSRVRARGGFVVWTIPSPWRVRFRCCPSSLYTFPLPGLARDCHLTGFPDFEQFCISGFPGSTQTSFKSVASTDSATPAWPPPPIASRLSAANSKLLTATLLLALRSYTGGSPSIGSPPRPRINVMSSATAAARRSASMPRITRATPTPPRR
jgi:hypothetical protein